MTEQWRPVVGYEGYYEVSNLGRVRSLPRLDTVGRMVHGRIRKWNTSGPYPAVTLNRDGAMQSRRVHALVAEAFLGPKPEGRNVEVCHNNHDKSDPRAANLRWDTHQNNKQQDVNDGRHYQARRTHCTAGHEFTEENTRICVNTRGESYRQCVACHREYHREYDRTRRAQKKENAA